MVQTISTPKSAGNLTLGEYMSQEWFNIVNEDTDGGKMLDYCNMVIVDIDFQERRV